MYRGCVIWTFISRGVWWWAMKQVFFTHWRARVPTQLLSKCDWNFFRGKLSSVYFGSCLVYKGHLIGFTTLVLPRTCRVGNRESHYCGVSCHVCWSPTQPATSGFLQLIVTLTAVVVAASCTHADGIVIVRVIFLHHLLLFHTLVYDCWISLMFSTYWSWGLPSGFSL